MKPLVRLLSLVISFVCVIFVARAQAPAQEFELLKVERVDGVARANSIAAKGQYLYVAGGGKLYVLDASDPLSPKVTGEVSGLGNTRQIAIEGNYAYVSARECGVWIVDISNPRAPRIVRRIDTIELATGIDVAGGVCFVGLRQYGVEFIDVRDPLNPQHIGIIKTAESQSVKYADGLLYSGDWAKGEITVIDVRDLSKPEIISITALDGYGDGIDVTGGYCYAATGHHAKYSGDKASREGRGHGVEIFDVSDPRAPKLVSVTKFPPVYHNANDFWAPRVSGNILVVADTMNGAFVVDISDKANPKILYRMIIPDTSGRFPSAVIGGILPGDGVIYLTGTTTGLYSARFDGVKRAPEQVDKVLPRIPTGLAEYPTDPSKFTVYRDQRPAQARGVTVRGNTAYLAYSDNGLHILKLSEKSITLEDKLPIRCAYDVKVLGDRLYVAEGEDGLGIYRIEKSGKLTEVGRLPISVKGVGSLVENVWVYPDTKFAVISCKRPNLIFVDISDEANPKVVFSHTQRGIMYDNYLPEGLLQGRLGALRHSGGFTWFDLWSDPPFVSAKTTWRVASLYDGTTIFHDKLLLSALGRYILLDANQECPADQKAYTPLPEGIRGTPRTDGNTLVLSCRIDRRARCYDLTDPAAPKFIESRSYEFLGHPSTPTFWKHRLLIPAGYQGLLLEKIK